MTVAELIKALQDVPPDTKIYYHIDCEVVDGYPDKWKDKGLIFKIDTDCFCGYDGFR